MLTVRRRPSPLQVSWLSAAVPSPLTQPVAARYECAEARGSLGAPAPLGGRRALLLGARTRLPLQPEAAPADFPAREARIRASAGAGRARRAGGSAARRCRSPHVLSSL